MCKGLHSMHSVCGAAADESRISVRRYRRLATETACPQAREFGSRNALIQGIMSTLEYISAPFDSKTTDSKTTDSQTADSLTPKLENRTARIGVIGLGYVGLPLVLLFSEQDFPITGFDIDAKKIEVLG